MKIKTDAYYVIGRGHNYCQDYALATENSISLSDGCSLTSENEIYVPHKTSDIASRLVCLYNDPIKLLQNSIDLNISLDATHLYCQLQENILYTRIIGDGVIYIEYTSGKKIIKIYNFQPNTPLYVSYILNEKLFNNFINSNINCIETIINLNTLDTTTKEISDPWNIVNYIDVCDIKSISLFSDGVTDIHGIDTIEAVKALTSFKRTNNTFVMARMKAQLREWVSRDIYPNDDLSMATMIIEE